MTPRCPRCNQFLPLLDVHRCPCWERAGTINEAAPIGQGANDARVLTSRPLVTSGLLNPLHQNAQLRTALKALLLEATSGQHRRDRQNAVCKPMEEAVERAERLVGSRVPLRSRGRP